MRLKIRHLLAASGLSIVAAGPAFAAQTCDGEVQEMLQAVQSEEAWPQIEREFSDMAGDASVLAMKGDNGNCYAALAEMRRYLIDRDIIVADLSGPAGQEVSRGNIAESTSAAVQGVPAQRPGGDTATLPAVTERPAPTPERGPGASLRDRAGPSGDAEVTGARAGADVTVEGTEPDVRVVQSDPSVSVVQPEPDVQVVQSEPSVSVIQGETSAPGPRPTDAEAVRVEAEIAATAPDLSSILVREVEFGFDKTAITKEAQEVLAGVADIAAASPGARVLLTGFADSVGPAAYNMKLSERRVAAVADALTSMGIDRSRIETRHFGEERPEVSSPESQRERHNRRVEIRVVDPAA